MILLNHMNPQEIQKLQQQFQDDLQKAQAPQDLEALEILYLGRKAGKVSNLLRGLKDVSVEGRKTVGPLLQRLKNEIEQRLQERNSSLVTRNSQTAFDTTLPGKKIPMGHYSPLTTTRRAVEKVFQSMGFMVLDGPELESEYYNFDALNIPAWHPAREMWDTFYVEDTKSRRYEDTKCLEKETRHTTLDTNKLLLRTHTSSMQVRIMKQFPELPIRAIVPGTVHRNEATDARHEKAFLNVEGLMVGEGISLQNLISISRLFLKKVLAEDVEVRFRPGFFPFTEPSLELDISCLICKQKGCAVCKKTGWLEFMGAGMVHPNVLKAGGIDSKKYTGFAFGFGLDRLVMLKYGIDDVRLFRSQDLRFLQQF